MSSGNLPRRDIRASAGGRGGRLEADASADSYLAAESLQLIALGVSSACERDPERRSQRRRHDPLHGRALRDRCGDSLSTIYASTSRALAGGFRATEVPLMMGDFSGSFRACRWADRPLQRTFQTFV